MIPACDAGAGAVTRAVICTSPADGWLISRNWSLVPVIPEPPAVTVQGPPDTLSDPPALPISWQVSPDGPFASGCGGDGRRAGRPDAEITPARVPVMITPLASPTAAP